MAEGIDAKRLGLAGGIIYGAVILGMTLLSNATGFGNDALTLWSKIHPGYAIYYAGGSQAWGIFRPSVGLIYGFLCGFIGLYALAWIYNKLDGKV